MNRWRSIIHHLIKDGAKIGTRVPILQGVQRYAQAILGPRPGIRRLLLGLLVIINSDYCDYIARNYNSSWRYHSCYPRGLNGPQFYRWAEAKEAEVTDIWTKSAVGIHRGSITALRTGFTTVIVSIWKAPHPNSPCEWVKRLRSHLWIFPEGLLVIQLLRIALNTECIFSPSFSRWKC